MYKNFYINLNLIQQSVHESKPKRCVHIHVQQLDYTRYVSTQHML